MDIKLPRVVGTRPAVAPFLAALAEDLRGHTVVLDCRALLSGTPSFADELVKQVLRDRRADELLVLGANSDFSADLASAAEARDVSDRVHFKERAAAAG